MSGRGGVRETRGGELGRDDGSSSSGASGSGTATRGGVEREAHTRDDAPPSVVPESSTAPPPSGPESSAASPPSSRRGSHAPSLTTLVRRALDEALTADEKRAGCTLLVGVSGGPDSMALVHALARESAREHARAATRDARAAARAAARANATPATPASPATPAPFRVAACGIDHGLREAARAELRLAAELCASLGVPFTVRRVDLGPGPGNLQARARAARYAALEEHAARLASEHGGAVLLATAHHADDRAETFVLRLLRGAGLNGLAVLPLREGNRVRPLLRARRHDIDLHLERHHVPFARDPSNHDPRFTRVRVRHEVLPLLASLDPRVVEHLSALADELVSLRRAGAFTPTPGSAMHALSPQDPDTPPDSLPDDAPALGRRVREALARLGPASPRKMAVRLPKRRVATYDHEADQPVTSEVRAREDRDTPGDSSDSFPKPPRKLP